MIDFYKNFTNYIFVNHKELYDEAVEAIKKPVEKTSTKKSTSAIQKILDGDMAKSARDVEEAEYLASDEAEVFYNEMMRHING